VHLRTEENRCGQPHCTYCRNAPRRPTARDYAGLIGFGSISVALLVLVVLAAFWPRS
jgi:hypothetical protein